MGTAVSVDIRDRIEDADGAFGDVFAWLHSVDATFSTYKDDSEITRLQRGVITRADASADVRFVLEECERLRDETDGYFDAYASGSLDPSGFVKGWSVEVASSMLVERGSTNHFINAGGDVRVRGVPEEGRFWNVGISDPSGLTSLRIVVSVTDAGVATSGTSERGAHVYDPHTLKPATASSSVTIIGPELAYTDAYATAALAMGHRARHWLEGLPDHESYVIDAQGNEWSTLGFARCATTLV